jgi:hypothetical protein
MAAPCAPTVWLAPIIDTQITANTDRPPATAMRDLHLAGLPPASHLLVDAVGVQHVVVKSPRDHATLHITGSLAAAGSVRVRFEVTGVEALPAHRDAITALTNLLHPSAASPSKPGSWPVERLELRDALIALDGQCVGASRREVACVMLGSKLVDAEWPDPDAPLRHKIKRDLGRGHNLIDGGYRELLKKIRARALRGRS